MMLTVLNSDFENAPAFTAAQTAGGKWIDGTAAGSSSDDQYGWILWNYVASGAAQFDSAVSHSGSNSIKLSTVDTSGKVSVFNRPGNAAGILAYGISIEPSTTYRFSAWVKTNNVATNAVYLKSQDADSEGVNGTAVTSQKLSGTNDWTLITWTHTTASDAFVIDVQLWNYVAGNVSDAWFDDILLDKTSIKSIDGLLKPLVKSKNGLAIGSIKSFNGII